MTTLRAHWSAGEPTLGAWLSLSNPVSAEATARSGFDFVCIDMQHGIQDYLSGVGMIQAILAGGGQPIARVPWNDPGIIGKVLDAGAQGIIVPMVNSAEEARSVVRSCRYPPDGTRSWGPTVVSMRTGSQQYDRARDDIAVIPMIETTQALASLDEIMSVPGIDAVYVGPSDLSLTLGLVPGNNDGEPLFDDALTEIVAACGRHGIVPGIHSTGGLTPRRLEQGFRMVTVTSDLLAMRAGYGAELAKARESAGTGATAAGPMY